MYQPDSVGHAAAHTWTPRALYLNNVNMCKWTRSQFPICPAVATTVHRRQGRSLKAVQTDIDDHCRVPNIVYTALSRATTKASNYSPRPRPTITSARQTASSSVRPTTHSTSCPPCRLIRHKEAYNPGQTPTSPTRPTCMAPSSSSVHGLHHSRSRRLAHCTWTPTPPPGCASRS